MTTGNQHICEKTGKIRYTRKSAQLVANNWKYRWFSRMKHYYCKHCNSWHIGNDRKKPRRKRW